jgi:long-chain acyl-CoA synthetase
MPNPEFGEEVVAAVVPASGRTVDPPNLRAYAREHLAPYKVPRQVIVVDALPRSLIGKVLHRQLRERLLAHPP